jgi:hypothetical protein
MDGPMIVYLLTRYFGCLAPNSKILSQIVPKAEPAVTECAAHEAAEEATSAPKINSKRMSWAKLLARVFAISMETCSDWGGELKIIGAIMEGWVIRQILRHLKIPENPPDIAPSRLRLGETKHLLDSPNR